MIVIWKKPKAGLLVLPVVKDGEVVKKITLLLGANEVDKNDWEAAKASCKDHIENGWLEEVVEKIEEEKVDPKTKQKKKVSRKTYPTLNKLSAKKAVEIVEQTFDLATLKKWLEKEARDEIRAKLANKIDSIENYKGQ